MMCSEYSLWVQLTGGFLYSCCCVTCCAPSCPYNCDPNVMSFHMGIRRKSHTYLNHHKCRERSWSPSDPACTHKHSVPLCFLDISCFTTGPLCTRLTSEIEIASSRASTCSLLLWRPETQLINGAYQQLLGEQIHFRTQLPDIIWNNIRKAKRTLW